MSKNEKKIKIRTKQEQKRGKTVKIGVRKIVNGKIWKCDDLDKEGDNTKKIKKQRDGNMDIKTI